MMKWVKLFRAWRDARIIKEYDAAGPSIIVRPSWLDFVKSERERDRKWAEDYAKLDATGKAVVRRLLDAQIEAGEGMRGYR